MVLGLKLAYTVREAVVGWEVVLFAKRMAVLVQILPYFRGAVDLKRN